MVPSRPRRSIHAFVTGSRRTLPASTLGAAVAGGGTVTHLFSTVAGWLQGPATTEIKRTNAPGGRDSNTGPFEPSRDIFSTISGDLDAEGFSNGQSGIHLMVSLGRVTRECY